MHVACFVVACIALSQTSVSAFKHDRQLQASEVEEVLWRILEGTACEVVEGGCLQSAGFPGIFPVDSHCKALILKGGFTLVTVNSTTFGTVDGEPDADALDYFVINGITGLTTYQETPVTGTVDFFSDDKNDSSSGWKLCLRRPCSTMLCPAGYSWKQESTFTACAGQTCSLEADLDTCCEPVCRDPPNRPGWCGPDAYYAQGDPFCDRQQCPQNMLYSTGQPFVRHCRTPGGFHQRPDCIEHTRDYPQWEVKIGSCEHYSVDCVQSPFFPQAYFQTRTGEEGDVECLMSIKGRHQINVVYMDLEDYPDEDYIQIQGEGGFQTTRLWGRLEETLSYIIEDVDISFEADILNHRSGFRICAKNLCDSYTCPPGLVFNCDQELAPCTEVLCSDVDAPTCCRTPTAEELANGTVVTENSSYVTMGCGVEATTTTTTTPKTEGMVLGYVELGIARENATEDGVFLVTSGWTMVLFDLLDIAMDDIFVLGEISPNFDATINLSRWKLGYEVKYAAPALGNLTERSTTQLTIDLKQAMGLPVTDTVVTVLANVAASGQDGVEWRSDTRPLCRDTFWQDSLEGTIGKCSDLTTVDACNRLGEVPEFYQQFLDAFIISPIESCCGCGGGECQAGSFRLRDNVPRFCGPCSPGSFSYYGMAGSCERCYPGSFSSGIAATFCEGAPPGRYVPTWGMTESIPCAAGNFTRWSYWDRCERCEPGTYNPSEGQSECRECPAGQYTGSYESTACTRCDDGFFAPDSGYAACLPCDAGESTRGGAHVTCQPCEPGTFAPAAGSMCSSCKLGTFAEEDGAVNCTLCPEGYFGGFERATTCILCWAGTESSIQGATACENCLKGLHKPEGELNCTSCSPGRFTDREASSACTACSQGSAGGDEGLSACSACLPGQFTAKLASTECELCAPGLFEEFSSSSACTECAAGTFAGANGSDICDPCSNGTYSNEPGTSQCTECAPGTFNRDQGKTGCGDCGAGTYTAVAGQAVCLNCEAGHYNPVAGLTECFDCQPGRYAETAVMSECLQCRSGRFVAGNANSACIKCEDLLPGPPQLWTTWERNASVATETIWLEATQATDVSWCGCQAGSQPVGQEAIDYENGGPPSDPINGRGLGCEYCIDDGLLCLGFGKLRIQSGYAWDGHLSVYDCSLGIKEACTGGLPGACAEGRDTGVVACARCLPDKVASNDGRCVECTGVDYVVPITLLSFALLIACGGYIIYDQPSRRRPSLTALLILISMGQLVTIVQQLTVVASIKVNWDAPLNDLFDYLASLSFLDIELLRPSCMLSMNPVRSYLGRVILVYLALSLMILAHGVSQVVQHRKDCMKRLPVLFGSLGTVMSAFFVSIVATMLGPLQCKKHPNGKETVAWYPSVLCFESDNHDAMITIGSIACIMPLTFLVAAIWAASVFPQKLFKGSRDFLTGWGFLFFRYHTNAYWYAPLLLVRNAIVAAIPTLPRPATQILSLQFTLLVSLACVGRTMPWRAQLANYLEFLTHSALIFVTATSAFFVEDKTRHLFAVIAFVVILLMPIGIILLIVIAVLKIYEGYKKPYQFFLCHHKAGAGCFARLMKMRLLRTKGVTRKVFIDTDDLQNLDTLFHMVASETETLVAIHSAQLLTRPWCVGEIVTSHLNKLRVRIVRSAGVQPPSKDFISNFTDYVPDLSCLFDQGISVDMVMASLTFFQGLPALQMSEEVTHSLPDELAVILAQRLHPQGSEVHGQHKPMPPSPLAIIANVQELEGASTALILCDLLQPIASLKHSAKVHVINSFDRLNKEVSRAVLICTQTVFQGRVVEILIAMEKYNPEIMPVMSTSHFSFPTAMMLDACPAFQKLAEEDAARILSFVQSIFMEIAVDFTPAALSMTESILTARASSIADRIFLSSKGSSQRQLTSRRNLDSQQTTTGGQDSSLSAITVARSSRMTAALTLRESERLRRPSEKQGPDDEGLDPHAQHEDPDGEAEVLEHAPPGPAVASEWDMDEDFDVRIVNMDDEADPGVLIPSRPGASGAPDLPQQRWQDEI